MPPNDLFEREDLLEFSRKISYGRGMWKSPWEVCPMSPTFNVWMSIIAISVVETIMLVGVILDS
jgi:hypothetical protein